MASFLASNYCFQDQTHSVNTLGVLWLEQPRPSFLVNNFSQQCAGVLCFYGEDFSFEEKQPGDGGARL